MFGCSVTLLVTVTSRCLRNVLDKRTTLVEQLRPTILPTVAIANREGTRAAATLLVKAGKYLTNKDSIF